MFHPAKLYQALADGGVTFYAGVPDSLLKDFCAYVTSHAPRERHVITANEGGAVALCMGHHLATGNIGVVYMQNSGLGNAVNPLTSLCDAQVYGIPMLLVIGWRGEPGVKDEPQHVKMGAVTRALLEAIDVPHTLLPRDADAMLEAVERALDDVRRRQAPHALVVQKGTFEPFDLEEEPPRYPLAREQAIVKLVEALPAGAVVVATTGKPSRELYETRARLGQPQLDLLTVGGMGHASQIALGIALERPEREVVCVDGDGAVLMHMGGLATIAALAPRNYRHVVLNNAAHDSVGGQPTVGFEADLCGIARAAGYRQARLAASEGALLDELGRLFAGDGPRLLEVRVGKGSRADLGRPSTTPAELKRALRAHLAELEPVRHPRGSGGPAGFDHGFPLSRE